MEIQRYVLIDALVEADLDEDSLREEMVWHDGGTVPAILIDSDRDASRFLLSLAEVLQREGDEEGISVARRVADGARVEGLGRRLYLYLPYVEIVD